MGERALYRFSLSFYSTTAHSSLPFSLYRAYPRLGGALTCGPLGLAATPASSRPSHRVVHTCQFLCRNYKKLTL